MFSKTCRHRNGVDAAWMLFSQGLSHLSHAGEIRVIASACHYIFFFTSHSSGERWQTKHPKPETVLLPLDSAVDFGKRSNAHLFGTELTRRKGVQASRQGRPAETARRAHG